jgi:solute carrier family 25 carnitine/acylcarnitine transporter 20/29
MSPVELVKVSQQTVGTKLRAALPSLHHPWRGLGATLLRDGIPHGVWFVSYEACKDVMMAGNGTDAESSVQVPLVSGAVAATVAWAVGYPADLIKTRVQASQTPLTIRQTAAQLIEESNGRVIPSLYRGFGMKLVRAIPASMIGFTVYEMVKKEIEQRL